MRAPVKPTTGGAIVSIVRNRRRARLDDDVMVESKGSATMQRATTLATHAPAAPTAAPPRTAFPAALRRAFGAAVTKGAGSSTHAPLDDGPHDAPRVTAKAVLDDEERSRDGHRTPSSRANESDADAVDQADPLDPIFREHGLLTPMRTNEIAMAPPTPLVEARVDAAAPARTAARASLEDVLPAIVRRIAWSGDARRGTVRIELGAGALAGATLLIESNDGRVRVHLSAPLGVDAESWRERIGQRLAARRIAVDAIVVE